MIRKWMTTLLALMLAVMVPVCALADRQHTLTVIPGDALGATEAIADLAEVLFFNLTYGDEAGAVSAGLGEETMFSVAAAADYTGLFVQSNLLGEDVFYLSWEDGMALLSQAAASEMGQETMDMVQNALNDQISQIMSVGSGSADALVNPDAAIEELKKLFADDPAMYDIAKRLYKSIGIETGKFTSELRDEADGRISFAWSAKDLQELFSTKTVRRMMEESITTSGAGMTADELKAAADSAMEEIIAILGAMEMEGVFTLYTAGDEVVGVELDIPVTIAMEGTSEKAEMRFDYNRLTDNNGVYYKAEFNAGMPEETNGMFSIVFDYYKSVDEVFTSEGMLAMLAAGEQFTITYDAETRDQARTRTVGLYMRDGATAVIEPAASERPLITFQVISQNADPAVLKAVKEADANTAVNVLKLSEEAMNNLMTDIQVHFTQIYTNVLSNLPASVLTMLMNME